MMQYPMFFFAEANATLEGASPWQVSVSDDNLSCAIPREFGGAGGAPSPEDFFSLALTNCFLATFKVYSNASRLKCGGIRVHSKLVLDKDASNQPRARLCLLKVHIIGVEDIPRAVSILRKVSQSGILLNSVKTEIGYEFNVNGEMVS